MPYDQGNAGQSAESARELTGLLSEELETLQALHAAIEAEYSALLGTDAAALESATQSKTSAIESHRQQQGRRLQWMAERDIDGSIPLAQLVTQAGGDTGLAALQSELSSLAGRCQQENRRNGGLISRLQERTQGALDILRGETATADIYSVSGAKTHTSDGKSLGKA